MDLERERRAIYLILVTFVSASPERRAETQEAVRAVLRRAGELGILWREFGGEDLPSPSEMMALYQEECGR